MGIRIAFLLLVAACLAEGAAPLYVTREVSLDRWDSGAQSFGKQLCGKGANSTAALVETCSRYKELVGTIEADLGERMKHARKELPRGPIDTFDARWLASARTAFHLVGITTRWDRLPFVADGCGEMRLVYRLAAKYEDDGKPQITYLPMTAMIVYELPGSRETCAARAAGAGTGETIVERVSVSPGVTRRIEINLLGLRVESPLLPESAGYAEYVMRIFRIPLGSDALTPMALENTPDIARLKKDAKLRAALLSWISQPGQLKEIDRGTAKLPERFLATRAISVSPFGALRGANAPFSVLLDREALDALDLSSYAVVSTPERLLRRLNGMSCQGCHQMKSDAGFHFLGTAPKESFEYNRTLLPASAHFLAEQPWRESFRAALATGKPLPPRPLPDRTASNAGAEGDACTLADKPEGYSCREDLSCRQPWDVPDRIDLQVGYCQRKRAPLPGEPCILGYWRETNDLRAGLTDTLNTDCFGRGQCLPQEIGFPGGLCVTACENLLPGSICHRVPALQRFTDCRANGRGLAHCFEKAATPTALRSCKIDMPCRPDYVCASTTEQGDGTEGGACVPPYFLPQLNVRGHRF